MKNFISIFTIVTFGFATMVSPTMSHAASKDAALHKYTSSKHDCHKSDSAKRSVEKNINSEKIHAGKCCDKGMCKCVGSSCHNSLSKIFNSSDLLPTISASKSIYGYDKAFIISAVSERLKRPPRA